MVDSYILPATAVRLFYFGRLLRVFEQWQYCELAVANIHRENLGSATFCRELLGVIQRDTQLPSFRDDIFLKKDVI